MRVTHWISTVILLTVLCVSALSASGQDGLQSPQPVPTQTAGSQIIDLARLAVVSAEIKKKQPQISDQVLEQDAVLIKKALPTITAEYWGIGLTEDDAFWASLRGWKRARLESPLKLKPEQPMDESSFMTLVVNDEATRIVGWRIRNNNPEIKSRVLKKDIVLIDASQAEITATFEKLGWDASDARQASLSAWGEVRLNSALRPNQSMSRESFIAFVESTGIMLFDSEPDQADVFMGPSKIGTTSKEKARRLQRTFEDGKKVTVNFAKPGFVSETKECIAKARDTVECKAELKPKQ